MAREFVEDEEAGASEFVGAGLLETGDGSGGSSDSSPDGIAGGGISGGGGGDWGVDELEELEEDECRFGGSSRSLMTSGGGGGNSRSLFIFVSDDWSLSDSSGPLLMSMIGV